MVTVAVGPDLQAGADYHAHTLPEVLRLPIARPV